MAKSASFQSDFASAIVGIGGVPVALHGTVEITITEPAKLDDADKLAWEMLKRNGGETITLIRIPAAVK